MTKSGDAGEDLIGRLGPHYTRHGTTSLFAALDAKTGTVIAALHRRQRSIRVSKVPQHDRRRRAKGPRPIQLVLDNYGTRKTALIRRWLARSPRARERVSSAKGDERAEGGCTTADPPLVASPGAVRPEAALANGKP